MDFGSEDVGVISNGALITILVYRIKRDGSAIFMLAFLLVGFARSFVTEGWP